MFKNLLVPLDLAHESSWRTVLPRWSAAAVVR